MDKIQSERDTRSITLHLSEEFHELLKRASAFSNMEPESFLLFSMLSKADMCISKESKLAHGEEEETVSAEDQKLLLEFSEQNEPNDMLLKRVERYKYLLSIDSRKEECIGYFRMMEKSVPLTFLQSENGKSDVNRSMMLAQIERTERRIPLPGKALDSVFLMYTLERVLLLSKYMDIQGILFKKESTMRRGLYRSIGAKELHDTSYMFLSLKTVKVAFQRVQSKVAQVGYHI